MSRTPKFLTSVELSHSKKTNGDKFPLLSSRDGDAAEQRNTTIKLAWFFSLVALPLVLADFIGRVKNETHANLGIDSTAEVSSTLSPPVRSGERAGFSLRFRLSNSGNHSVFYRLNPSENYRSSR